MGGDLVRGPDVGAPNQDAWFQYLATRMSDILDAYSIHVFWDYWDTQKLRRPSHGGARDRERAARGRAQARSTSPSTASAASARSTVRRKSTPASGTTARRSPRRT